MFGQGLAITQRHYALERRGAGDRRSVDLTSLTKDRDGDGRAEPRIRTLLHGFSLGNDSAVADRRGFSVTLRKGRRHNRVYV